MKLEMWANAQHDGRPAEHRWRLLFKAAKFGWRPLLDCRASCSNAAKTRNPLKLAGVPQTRQQISAASRPKFAILLGHMGEILRFNRFFSDCRYVPYLRRYSPTKSCDGVQMANFCRFFCVLRFQRAACSTFQTCILNSHYRVTPCVEVW